MQLSVITPERTLIEKETVTRVTLPTVDGEITVLPGHAPVITVLASGELVIGTEKEERPFAVSGGFVEITKKEVRVLADSAEPAAELDIDRAEDAIKRAEELLKNKEASDIDLTQLMVKLEKERARIKVAKKHRDVGKQPREQSAS